MSSALLLGADVFGASSLLASRRNDGKENDEPSSKSANDTVCGPFCCCTLLGIVCAVSLMGGLLSSLPSSSSEEVSDSSVDLISGVRGRSLFKSGNLDSNCC